MLKNFRYLSSFGCAAVLTGMLSGAASGGLIEIVSDLNNSEHQAGQLHGTLQYEASTGVLTVWLTNMSDPANGGYLTGFLFNIDSNDPNATATLTSASHPFLGITHQVGSPFGRFTAGAALGGNWAGSAPPSQGIAAGHTGVFVFEVSAFDASDLEAESFIRGDAAHNFVVRFRGFKDGGSDKVPVVVIPTPATLPLLLAGGFIGTRRRRR